MQRISYYEISGRRRAISSELQPSAPITSMQYPKPFSLPRSLKYLAEQQSKVFMAVIILFANMP